jgi:hypothetical protein
MLPQDDFDTVKMMFEQDSGRSCWQQKNGLLACSCIVESYAQYPQIMLNFDDAPMMILTPETYM